jgi:outer membrane protein assembly factor BamB
MSFQCTERLLILGINIYEGLCTSTERSMAIYTVVTSKSTILMVALSSAAFSQTITLSPISGPPTSTVEVSGSGFSPNASITIYFSATDEASATADGSGSFSNAIQVPASALPGKRTVTAVPASGDKAQAIFTVYTDWRELGFSPARTAFNPYENVLNPSNVSGLSVQWSFPTGSNVNSSPAVVNGVVYVGSNDFNVYALNAGTGAKLWSYETGGIVQSSPAVVNGVVYVGSEDHKIYALNSSTGAKVWSYTTGSQVVSSPAVVNGKVFIGAFGGHVFALDARTGVKLWSYVAGGAVSSSPAVANGKVYFGSYDYNVYALDADTGTKLWSFATGFQVPGSPAVANGVVYIGSCDSNVYALDATTGVMNWSYTTGNYVASSPAVANGVVYIGSYDGYLYALDAGTGAKLWSFFGQTNNDYLPTVANGVVYFGVGGCCGTPNNVYALDASTGAALWSYAAGAQQVTVANGKLYVGAYLDDIYAFTLLPGTGTPGDSDH